MLFPRLRSNNPTTSDTPLDRLRDEAEMQPIIATLSVLRDLHTRLEKERDRLGLETYFADNRSLTNTTPDGPRDKMLRARLQRLQADNPPKPQAVIPGAPDPLVAAALALLDGAKAVPAETRATRQIAVDRELQVVGAGLTVQEAAYAEMESKLSHRKSEALRPEHDTMILEIFRATQALTRLVDAERAFRADILRGGYMISPDVIGPPNMSGLLSLGSEQQHDSQISTYRRHLESLGVLK